MIKPIRFKSVVLSLLSLLLIKGAQAAQKSSAGMTFLESSGARPSALAEAFSSVQNDISAMGYNPASLSTLKTGHASFMYQKGIADDAFGEVRIGVPKGFGLSVGYYNGGDVELVDQGQQRTAVIQKDLAATFGYARPFGRISVGAAGKYLSSELAESAKATAYALDLGMQMPMGSRLNFGAALQNIGTKMKYIEEAEALPMTARIGFSLNVLRSTLLLLDGVYDKNSQAINPAIGVESLIGPMALRAGYKSGSDLEGLTLGAGFLLSRFSFDYSFGLVQDLDSRHKVSVSMRFGSSSENTALSLGKPSQDEVFAFKLREKAALESAQREKYLGGKIYEVRAHDTLGKIAKRMYGDSREWKKIYEANRHIVGQQASLEVGQKLVLP